MSVTSQEAGNHVYMQTNREDATAQTDTMAQTSLSEFVGFETTVQPDGDSSGYGLASATDSQKEAPTSPPYEDMSTPKIESPLLKGLLPAQDHPEASQAAAHSPAIEVQANERPVTDDGNSVEAKVPGEKIIQLPEASIRPDQAASAKQRPSEDRSLMLPHDSSGQSINTWKDTSPHISAPPTSHPATTRPVSVPNFPTNVLTMHQGGDSHGSQHPDRTFEALQYPQYPPPRPSRMPRTRSSHSSGFSHTGSSYNEHIAKDTAHNHGGSRTVGNTPTQSPGLYSPSVPSRNKPPNTDDGRSSSQILHVAHLQEPKETHVLKKDFDPMTGRKVLNNYELIDKLGSGQHGTVKLGRNLETSEYVAVKIVRRFSKKLRLGKAGNPNDTIKKEVAVLKKARHPHIVSLFEVIDDDEFDKVYLVLEYVERGEIVWRKTTDKAIAQFELDRLSRERANGFDEAFEDQALQEFNASIPARRLEKARRLEDQKRQARERLTSVRHRSHYTAADPFWTLELGAEAENEHITPTRPGRGMEDSRLSRADIHAAEHAGNSPESATPVYTSSPVPQVLQAKMSTSQPSSQPTSAPSSVPPSQPTSQPASQPVSRPETPTLEGTMYGPYLENKSKSDADLQVMLDRVIAQQSDDWSLEEEGHRYVPCLTLSQAREVFRDTVLGLGFLHYQGIIHRDIKPANLLWTTDYRVKISDFGVSYLGNPIREVSDYEEASEADVGKMDEALELAKTVGTPAFYAPELCDPQLFQPSTNPDRPEITGQIDVWALGVTLYCMVYGRLPFFDPNEFKMYEKIAHEEVFIPRRRLKGVEHNDEAISNHNKRIDDVLEYEGVDDTLWDLLKKLLAKQPGQRISLKEVKHHPWVVTGIENKERWLDETDPSRQSEGKKIEVSTQEVEHAVVSVTGNLVDRIKTGVQRLSSVLRGRGSRKRTNSNPKFSDSIGSTSIPKSREERRISLRGDEQIFSALKASREGGEHPLAQSVAASPEIKNEHSYFYQRVGDPRPQSAVETSKTIRPSISERSMSTADSMKTVKASDTIPLRQTILPDQRALSPEDFSTTTTTVLENNNSSSGSLGGLFGGAGRRFVNSMRSRERGLTRQSPSQSSRSSSVDANTHAGEDYHASPSLGISSAVAAGHVDLPPALREEAEVEHYRLPSESSAESFQRAQEVNQRRHQAEYMRQNGGHRRSVTYAADIACPPSPDDDIFFHHYQQRPASAAESSFAISSSSDQIVSGDSTAHSRIPSVVSGASSLSVTLEEDIYHPSLALEKSFSPLMMGRRSSEGPRTQPEDEMLNPAPALTKAAAEEEAGYNGEGEQESDSDDDGLAMTMA